MDKDVAARLDALEEALAHQARMIEDLSEVIAARDGEIARLGRGEPGEEENICLQADTADGTQSTFG